MKKPLTLRTYLGYGVGDFGQNMVFQAAGIYLLNFYTDVYLIPAAFAGALFLLARIWDGINDPIMGYLAQRTRSRWGSYRPYLLFASFPLAVSMALLFSAPEFSETGKLVYVVGTYLLFGMTFTLLNVPFGTLTAVMTSDYEERSTLTGYRMTFAMVGGIIAGFLFLPFVNLFDDPIKGYQYAGLIMGGILVVTLLISFFTVKETEKIASNSSISLNEVKKHLKLNRPFWLLAIAFGCCFAALGLFSATVNYYFDYYIGDKSLVAYAMLVVMGTTALSIPVWVWVANRWDKRIAFLIGAGFYILAYGAMFWVQPNQLYLLFGLFFIQGIGNGSAAFASWAMIPDTVEFGEWKSGIRIEGVLYGIYGVALKLGLGLGAAITGFGLSYLGYVPNVEQSTTALFGIKSMLTLGPLFFIIAAFCAIYFYRISKDDHKKIREALAD